MPIVFDREMTVEEIKERLRADRVFLEKCIVALYEHQTQGEQATRTTRETNGVGFNSVDAPFMTSIAQEIIADRFRRPMGRRLSDRQTSVSARLMVKYAAQLHRMGTVSYNVAARVTVSVDELFDRVAEANANPNPALQQAMAQAMTPTPESPAPAPARPRRSTRPREWLCDILKNGEFYMTWYAGENCPDESTARTRFNIHVNQLRDSQVRDGNRFTFANVRAE